MKSTLTVLICAILLCGCIKSPEVNSVFGFAIGNNQFNGNLYNAGYNDSTLILQSRFALSPAAHLDLSITGGNNLSLQAYNIGSNNPNGRAFSFTFYPDTFTSYVAQSGSVSITASDTITHRLSGKFFFTCTNINTPFDSANITNGFFNNVSYTVGH